MCEVEASQTLPDTQPVSQPVEDFIVSNCQEPLRYWGRLYPVGDSLRFHDLINSEITVGRDDSCEIRLTERELSQRVLSIISKRHFTISRGLNLAESGSISHVTITDCSLNGTFVNGQRVKTGSQINLNHNDLISVGRPLCKLFYYLESRSSSQIPHELQMNYDVSIRLGNGAFGEVSLVFSKHSGKSYAMKTINKGNQANERRLFTELKKLDNECLILKSLKHPNVIQLIDVVDCAREKFLILELMQGKDLYDRITSNNKLLEPLAKLYFYQIASGVQYLHSQGVIHRDLKPENVLLASDKEVTLLKISDFGLSKILHSNTYMHSLCGTKMYVAPEVLISAGSEEYTDQVDVWSMGVILYVCLSGQQPFSQGRDNQSIEDQIKTGNYQLSPVSWKFITLPAKKLVRRMMTVNPSKRITVNSILEDPWLSDAEMKAKVQDLIDEYKVQDKENSVPSPVPCNGMEHLSVNSSPPRKRIRLQTEDDTACVFND